MSKSNEVHTCGLKDQELSGKDMEIAHLRKEIERLEGIIAAQNDGEIPEAEVSGRPAVPDPAPAAPLRPLTYSEKLALDRKRAVEQKAARDKTSVLVGRDNIDYSAFDD